jgi:hypothetical protein
MGAWDTGPFDNDDASDWLYELAESSDTSVIASVLNTVANIGDAYLEAPECSQALTAAEIVAAFKGHPSEGIPENAKNWIENHQNLDVSELIPTSQMVVERIRTNSELKELWEESEYAPKWHSSLEDLLARLAVSRV